jgi:peroxiredoxin
MIELGQLLPDWRLDPIQEGSSPPSLDDLLGRPLLILFFNMTCPGCKGRAMPFANRMVLEHPELQVVGIHSNFNGGEATDLELQQAIVDFHLRFPVFRDHDLNFSFFVMQAGGTPHWVIADAKGIAQYSIFGSDPNNALLRLDLKLAELLG